MGNPDYTLYGHFESGNVYKVALLLALAGKAYDFRHVDIFAGASKSDDFTAMNTFQEIPVLVHGASTVTQSDVILRYLADDIGRFGGKDDDERRRIQEWMAWTSNKFTNGISQARFGARFAGYDPAVITFFQKRAESAFDLVDRHLADREWLVGDSPTIADISAAGYIFLAGEGGLDLTSQRKMLSWVGRLSMLPGWHHPDKMPRQDAIVAPTVVFNAPDDGDA
ncbi:MAG: glutathione S-transferase family protein [Alphaproteobacteria bacterium]|jgi:glutathione S-transferase